MKWSKKQHFASETREDKMSHGVVIFNQAGPSEPLGWVMVEEYGREASGN